MSTTYSDLGQALFDFVAAIDITSVEPAGWAHQLNRPVKSDELDDYPAFAVMPKRDTNESLASRTDDDTITYSVFLYASFRDATNAEEDIRALVDLVRTAFRNERLDPQTFGESYTFTFAGEWGGDETQGERFYRLDVTAHIAEDY